MHNIACSGNDSTLCIKYISFFNYFDGLIMSVPRSLQHFFPIPASSARSIHPTLKVSHWLSEVNKWGDEIKLPGVAFSYLFKWIPGSLSCSLIMQVFFLLSDKLFSHNMGIFPYCYRTLRAGEQINKLNKVTNKRDMKTAHEMAVRI